MLYSRFYPLLVLIFLGIVSRFIPHPPNFTALAAIALLSSYSLGNLWLGALAVLSCTFLTDLVLGFYSSLHFVYLSYGIIVLLGHWIDKKSPRRTILLLIASSLIFFVITNFGDWMTLDLYPKTISGLVYCYVAGLPFLLNHILGTLFYGAIIYGKSIPDPLANLKAGC